MRDLSSQVTAYKWQSLSDRAALVPTEREGRQLWAPTAWDMPPVPTRPGPRDRAPGELRQMPQVTHWGTFRSTEGVSPRSWALGAAGWAGQQMSGTARFVYV